jgi:hypothetical protein
LRTRIPVAAAVLLLGAGAVAGASDSLSVFLDGDYLRIALPHLDFLKGKPLERLKDGGTVVFSGQLRLLTSPNALLPVAKGVTSFAFSYDIWEERFSITKLTQSPESRHTWQHLSAQAAEAIFLDNLVIDRGEVPGDRDFYIQLELRPDEARDQLGIIGNPGIDITRVLIEMFGRPPRSPQERMLWSGGPFRMSDLKKTEVRSKRG